MRLLSKEAEDLKINGDSQGNLPQEIVEIVGRMLNTFFSEVKKTLNFYMQASSIESIEHCYITGGSSLIPGLLEGMEGLMGIKVNILNPFDRLEYNSKNIDNEALQQIAISGGVGLGLGIRMLPKW